MAVAVSGIIGFVGLIIPHAIRLVMGRITGYCCLFCGSRGHLLIIADTMARTLVSPMEIPLHHYSLGRCPVFVSIEQEEREI